MTGLVHRAKALLPKGNFARSVTMLAGGTALGQALVVLASPLLTRLYTPEDFGVLGVYISLLAMLVVIASWRYELAIPLLEDDASASNLLVLAMIVVLLMSALTGMVVWLMGEQVISWTNTPALQPYLWLLPLGLLGAGLYQALNYWAVRKQKFGTLAQTKLYQSIAMVVVQVGAGVFHLRPLGLLLGDVVGRTNGSGTLAVLSWRESSASFKQVSFAGIRQLAARYRRFPLLSSGSALLNAAGLQLPIILLAGFYGPQVVGWFALGQRIVGIPMSLIGRSVAQVYMGEAAKLRGNPDTLNRLYWKTAKRLLLIGVVPFALLALCSGWLFVVVFGESWREAGLYVQLMSAMFLVQFVVVPLSQTLNILEQQDWQLLWDVGRLAAVVGGLVVVHLFSWPAWSAVATYSASMLAAYLALLGLSSLAIRRRKA
jgi:O-antigen/teichoic acid export membrane protein